MIVAHSPRPSCEPGRLAGFTLVEMLVALFIFGLLAAAGVAVMSYAIDAQAQVRAHTDRTGDFQRMRAILKADLAQAAPRPTRGLDGVASPQAFRGGEDGVLLSLVRRGWENPEGRPRASLQYVEYRLVERRLERSTRTALDGAPLGPPQILFDGVARLQPAFLAKGRWTPVWVAETPSALPEAVRLEMELDDVGALTQLFAAPGGSPR